MERTKFSLFFGRSIGHFIGYGLGLLVIAVLLSKLAAPILCTESKQSQKPRTIEPSLNISPIEVEQQESSAEYPDSLKERIKKLNSEPMFIINTPQASGELGVADKLYQTAMQYEEKGIYSEALTNYTYASILYKAEKNSAKRRIACFDKIALINLANKFADQVFYSYNKIIEIAQSTGDKKSLSTAFIKIGIARNHFGERQQALKAFEQGLSTSNAISDKEGQAFAFYNLGTTYSNLGEKQKALSYLNQALPLFQAIGNSERADATVQIIKELS